MLRYRLKKRIFLVSLLFWASCVAFLTLLSQIPDADPLMHGRSLDNEDISVYMPRPQKRLRALKSPHNGKRLILNFDSGPDKVYTSELGAEEENPTSSKTKSDKFLFSQRRSDDRIIEQLDLIKEVKEDPKKDPIVILLLGGVMPEDLGDTYFRRENCPINNCMIVDNENFLHSNSSNVDVVIFRNDDPDYYKVASIKKPRDQLWIFQSLESPHNSPSLVAFRDRINWTATYRPDSTIVTPYAKYVGPTSKSSTRTNRNYAKGKTKLAAWFATNCGSKNGRTSFVKDIQKYMDVDVYGYCGPLKCDRSKQHECFEMLSKEYKFYFSFENSNCQNYITEKFFENALRNDVVPVVMGANYEDYLQVAPRGSFIHVNQFNSTKELVDYLLLLDRRDDLYNQYFDWKSEGRFVDTQYWCRLCAMLNRPNPNHWYQNIEDWWRGPGVCEPANLVDFKL